MKLRLLVGIAGTMMLATAAADAKPFAYVLNRGSSQVTAGKVSVIDMATNAVVGTPIDLQAARPYSLAVSAKGGKIYVATQGTASTTDQTLKILDADQLTVVGPVTAANGNIAYVPGGMVLNSAETRLYVADQTNSRLYVYDLNGNDLSEVGYLDVSHLGATSGPEGVAIDEANGRLYVVNSLVDTVAVFDLAMVEADAVNHDGSSRLADVVLPAGTTHRPTGIAVAANGKVYVSCSNSNRVVTFTAAAPQTVNSITVGSSPYGITANGDGSKVYVANAGDNISRVTIITTATDAKTTVNGNTALNGYACSVAESSDPVAPANRYLITNVPINEASATANSDVSSVAIGGTTATQIIVGVNPCSLGNFMGPKLPYSLTTSVTAGTGTITPSQTIGAAANTVLAAAGAYKTFKLTPTGSSTSVQSVTVGGQPYGAASEFTVGPINSDLLVQVAFEALAKYKLTAKVIGGGYCKLTSNPAGINVSMPANIGIGDFAANTSVVVTATAETGYEFKGWTTCPSPSANACTVVMPAGAYTIEANCEPLPARSEVKRGTKYYDTIEQAVNDASNPATLIQIVASPTKMTNLPQNCNYSYGVQEITLSGGWDANFTAAAGHSILPIGTLTISAGTMVAENLTIQ